MPGSVTTAEADWWVDPANGSASAAGTQSDPLDSIYRFDEDEANSLSAGDTVALVDSAPDVLPDRLSLSFLGERTTTGTVKLGDPTVSRNGTPITIGTWGQNDGDYVIDCSNLGTDVTGIYQFKTDNVDWRGASGGRIVIRGAKNHGMKLESPNEVSQAGIYEYVRFEDYGNDSTSRGGNGIWVAEGYNGGVMRDCSFYDGSEPADSDGVYFGGPSGNRPGGWLFERCVSSYNADDGYDFFRSDSDNPVVLVDCIAHHNGRDVTAWTQGDGSGTTGAWGDGNGFKMAGDAGGNSWCYRCFAWKNQGRLQGGSGDPNGSGFDDNGQPNQRYLNCAAWDNEEWGFRCATSDTLIINSWGYENGDGDEDGSATTTNNAWNLSAVTLSDTEFKSVTPGTSGFFVPTSDSTLVDAGVVLDGYTVTAGAYPSYTIDLAADPPLPITETFSDASPEIGAYETTASSDTSDGTTDSGSGDRIQWAEASQTLSPGASMTVTVETAQATRVITQVDNGSGGPPAQYDLVQEVAPDDTAAYMVFDELDDRQTRAVTDVAVPEQYRVTLTNDSGSNNPFRLRAIAVAPPPTVAAATGGYGGGGYGIVGYGNNAVVDSGGGHLGGGDGGVFDAGGGTRSAGGGGGTVSADTPGADGYAPTGLPDTFDWEVSKSGSDTVVTDVAASSDVYTGGAQGAFDYLATNLTDGDSVHIQSGDYTIQGEVVFNNLSDIVWYSEGAIRLDDLGTVRTYVFRLEDGVDGWRTVGGTYDYDASNNADDGSPGTQTIWSLFDARTVEIDGVTMTDAADSFVQGAVDYLDCHHCTLDTSGERGFYLLGDCIDAEIHQCELLDIASGAFRGEAQNNEGPSNWYAHDNYITTRVTPERSVSPVYLFGGGPHNLLFERNEAVVDGDGTNDGYVGYLRGTDATGAARDCTFRENVYAGVSGSDLKFFEITDGGDYPGSIEFIDETLDNIANTIDAS